MYFLIQHIFEWYKCFSILSSLRCLSFLSCILVESQDVGYAQNEILVYCILHSVYCMSTIFFRNMRNCVKLLKLVLVVRVNKKRNGLFHLTIQTFFIPFFLFFRIASQRIETRNSMKSQNWDKIEIISLIFYFHGRREKTDLWDINAEFWRKSQIYELLIGIVREKVWIVR